MFKKAVMMIHMSEIHFPLKITNFIKETINKINNDDLENWLTSKLLKGGRGTNK